MPPASSSAFLRSKGEVERRFDLAARERLLAALARLEPGLSRIERELEALEVAKIARLVDELRTPASTDTQSAAADSTLLSTSLSTTSDAHTGVPHEISDEISDETPNVIRDEIFEESLLSGLSERAEDFIDTCREALTPNPPTDGDDV